MPMAEMQKSRRAPLQELQLAEKSSRSAIEVAKGVHAGLWLNKYIAGLEREDPATRVKLVTDVASIPMPTIYRAFYERWKSNLKTEYHAISREFAVKGRMAVGLGNEGVLETSVALHHTYGVPYIPGSALKGLAANYARLMAGEGWQQGSPAYTAVFGDTKNAGFVTFFDALYIPGSSKSDCPLHADVITVHHPTYYTDASAPPADWDSPTPIPFLSATGNYLVALAAPDLDGIWIEKVFELLAEALLVMGIGAKTSSGYGRMTMAPVLSAADEAALVQVNEYLEKVKAIPDSQVTSQLKNFYYKWLQVKSQAARKVFAEAMVEKARSTGKEFILIKQDWYHLLVKSVN